MKNILWCFLISCSLQLVTNVYAQQKKTFIIDADTGNEMDDLYAIVRGLVDDSVKVIGLTSSHFNNPQLLTDSIWNTYPTKDIRTVGISQEINEAILKGMKMENIPHPEGSDRMVGFAWGYYPGAQIPPSQGVDFLIEMAQTHTPQNKLNILCLGPVTNVAAAILIEPEIASNIRLHILSMRYNMETKVWNKNTFNARNDINGLDLILNNSDLELLIMPGSVAQNLVFERDETCKPLNNTADAVLHLLSDRWKVVPAERDTWIMWDLALVEAFIHPEMATLAQCTTPPENTQRQIYVYTGIDSEKMKIEFWNNLRAYFHF